jgi:hypothetical protein
MALRSFPGRNKRFSDENFKHNHDYSSLGSHTFQCFPIRGFHDVDAVVSTLLTSIDPSAFGIRQASISPGHIDMALLPLLARAIRRVSPES